jgi:hypothetical protein
MTKVLINRAVQVDTSPTYRMRIFKNKIMGTSTRVSWKNSFIFSFLRTIFCRTFFLTRKCNSNVRGTEVTSTLLEMAGSTSISSPSNQFVKWINQSNVHRHFDKEKVKMTTQKSLFGERRNNNIQGDIATSTPANVLVPRAVLVDRSLLDTFDVEENMNHEKMTETGLNKHYTLPPHSSSSKPAPKSESFDEWECIHTDSHIELCTIPSDQHDGKTAMQ